MSNSEASFNGLEVYPFINVTRVVVASDDDLWVAESYHASFSFPGLIVPGVSPLFHVVGQGFAFVLP